MDQKINPHVFSGLIDLSGQRDDPAIFRLNSLDGDLRRLCELTDSDRIFQPQDFQEKENLLILLPLHVQGDVYGYLLATDAGSHIQSVEKRIELIEGISRQTALAIMNDRYQKEMVSREALEHEFQLAREIQQTFLPSKIPQIDGWDLDARWRPARKVGGDFYDLFYLPGQTLGVTIADISDKGVSAALYMTLTRTLMRAVIQETRNASETLERVNDLLLSETPHGVFVTALIGILNPRTGEFKYANAGHNLPILKSEDDGKISFLEKGEMALGVLPHVKYREHRIDIQPGEVLIFYTDGIPDTLDRNGNDFGMDRFLSTIRESKNSGAAEMLDAIDRNLMNFAGSQTPTDDVTVVGIKRLKTG
jgi:serine phosphatase RsbU (regulator of sigma subunit)